MAQQGESVLERDADRFLIGDHHDFSSRGDSEEERCRMLFRAALAAHFDAALCERVCVGNGVVTAEERDRSRRLLTSTLTPWREDREFICDAAGFDPEVIRARAAAMLAPLIQRERQEEAKHVETAEGRNSRLALLHHVALGGSSEVAGGLRVPKTAQQWLRVAIASGDDAALDRAAKAELAEVAA